MSRYLIVILLAILAGCNAEAPKAPAASPGVVIPIREIYRQRIYRETTDREYSGQIRSAAGLARFAQTHKIELNADSIDFDRQMLVFGITDDITTEAFQLLCHRGTGDHVLDYVDTGAVLRMAPAPAGQKHSLLQVFVLARIDGIDHLGVKNRIAGGLSTRFD